MADEIKVIRIEINAQKAVDGGKAVQRALDDIDRSTSAVARSVVGFEANLKAFFLGFLGVQAVRQLSETADAFTKFTNSLKVAGVAGADLSVVQDRLFAAANKHGVEIGAVGQLYSRLTMSSKELGASQTEMLKFVDGVTAALRVQGGSTEQASGALMQLAQAMGAGIVRAEEFNSILEGALPIAQAAARGIAGMEGSVAKLRAAVTEGKVSSQEFFEGTLRGFKQTEEQADRSSLTISAGVTTVTNAWTRFIGELDKTSGSSVIAVNALGNISKALAEVASQLERGRTSGEGFWATVLNDSRRTGRMGGLRLSTPEEQRQDELDRLRKERSGPAAQGRESMIDEEIRKLTEASRLAAQEQRNTEDMLRLLEGGLPARNAPPAAPGKKDGGGGTSAAKKDLDEVGELIKKIEADAQRMRDSFAEGTDAIKEQNDVLALELKLMDAAPEIRARELAILKATNDAKKDGVDIESQLYKDRLAAVDASEKLRIQQDEIKRSQELWTEPLKQALRDIQSIGADAFDKLLESGTFSFEELGQTFMRIVRRMAAEFLALATIRPVMSVLVNAVSPSMAQQMGLGGGSGGGMFGGGSGGFNMPSLGGGGGSGWFGNIGSFLNSPIMPQSIDAQIANWSTYGTAAQNSMSGGFLANTSWMQGIGALAGAGMGIYQLASGNGSASSTIGGISSIVGAGLSLIPGIGPFLGAGVSLLGNMLPGLFGMDKPPTITNQTYGQLTYGDGGWYTTGGAWGPSANSGDTERGLKSLGGGISSVFDLLGGVKDPRKVWGLSAQNKTVSGQGWSSSSDSLYLVDPNGNQQLWRMNEGNMMDTGSAQVAYRSILEGAVGAITENMRKAVTQTGQTMGGTSLQAIAETVAEVLAFDEAIANLGKTMVDAEKALKAVDDSFAAMYATADKYGLATGELDASKAAARLGIATDFAKGIDRDILQMTDPKAAALADVDDWYNSMVANNKWLIENVEGALDQIVKIEQAAALKRAAIVEAGAKASLDSLASTINRLTYGDLSGASPAATLSGLTGSFNAMLAQANAGDQTAIAGIGGAAADLAQFAGTYYGTATPAYQSLVGGLRGNLAGVYTAQGGTDPLIVALTTVSAQFAAAGQDNAELKEDMAEVTTAVTVLTEKLQRLLDKMAA